MKSSRMAAMLRECDAAGRKIAPKLLEYFASHGNARVRRAMFESIDRRSPATSLMSREPMFAFLIDCCAETFEGIVAREQGSGSRRDACERLIARGGLSDFFHDTQSFLIELSEYRGDDEIRRRSLQRFVTFMDATLRENPEIADLSTRWTLRYLVRSFPEVRDGEGRRRDVSSSADFAYWLSQAPG